MFIADLLYMRTKHQGTRIGHGPGIRKEISQLVLVLTRHAGYSEMGTDVARPETACGRLLNSLPGRLGVPAIRAGARKTSERKSCSMAGRHKINVEREDDPNGSLRRIAAQFGRGNGVELVVLEGALHLRLQSGRDSVSIPLEDPDIDFAAIVGYLGAHLSESQPLKD